MSKGEKYDEKIYEYAESKWRTRCKNAFKKAQEYYEGSSMLDVYEIDEWRDGGGVDHSYSVRGEIEADGLTLEELGAELESLQDEVEDLED